MRFDQIIIWISAAGILLGAIDRMIGNRFGLGEQFEEGLNIMGPLAVSMVGLICLAPVAANVIGPAVAPALKAIGCDPSLIGTILPNDTGGYPLAMALAENELAAKYSGLIVASMFGCTLTFTLPVGINLIDKKNHPYFLYGSLIGLICVPFGSVLGGIVAGIPLGVILPNTVPIAVLSVLFAAGLKLIPGIMLKCCGVFGRAVSVIATLGLAAAGFESLTGVVLIPGMDPVGDGMSIVGSIAVVLMGMMPILTLLIRLLKRPLEFIGGKVGLDVVSSAGLILTLCNGILTLKSLKDMNSRGKVCNCAFFVCAAAALGDHLGFTAGVEPAYITPMIAGKIFGGILSLALCALFSKGIAKLDEDSAAIAAKGQ